MSTVIADDKIRVGQKGVVFTGTVTRVISNADQAVDLSVIEAGLDPPTIDMIIEFENPNGGRIQKGTADGLVFIDAANGIFRYVETEGIFTVRSDWQVRGIAKFSSTVVSPGSWTDFPVGD